MRSRQSMHAHQLIEFAEVPHLQDWLQRCVETVFSELGARVTRTTIPQERANLSRCACIGFGASAMTGSLVLAANEPMLAASYSCRERSPSWVGELANLVMGRLKNEFWYHNIEQVRLGVPAIMNGHFMPPLLGNGVYSEARVFRASGGGLLSAWVDGHMDEMLVAKTMHQRTDNQSLLDPGGMMLF